MSMPAGQRASEPTAAAPDGLTLRDHVLPGDEEAIRVLVAATNRFSHAETEIAAELVRETLERGDDSGYRFLVACRNDRPVAYTCYGPIPCTTASYDLYWIAVDPALQGRGVGRWLLRESETRIRQAGGMRVFIDTSSRADYEPTRRFYQTCGYREAAVLDDFYAPGDAKVIFTRAL